MRTPSLPNMLIAIGCVTALSGCGTDKSTDVATENIVMRYTLSQAWSQDWTAASTDPTTWSLVANMKSMDINNVTDLPGARNVVKLEDPETIYLTIGQDSAEVEFTTQQPDAPGLEQFLDIFGDRDVYVAQLPNTNPVEATAEFHRASGEVISTLFTIPSDQTVTSPSSNAIYALGETIPVTWDVNSDYEIVRLRLNGCDTSFDYLRTENDGSATLDLSDASLPEGIDSCEAALQVISSYSFDLDESNGYHVLSEGTVERVSAVIPLTIIR